MRHPSWLRIGVAMLVLLAGCTRPADAPSPAARAPAVSSEEVEPPPPAITRVALVDPDSDSPFRWDPVLSGGLEAKVEDGQVWVPVLPVAAVLAPQSRVVLVDGKLRVDDVVVDIATRNRGGIARAEVAGLARAFGAFAYGKPEAASIALWPEPELRWLAEHGDPRAGARAGARRRARGPDGPHAHDGAAARAQHRAGRRRLAAGAVPAR